MTQDHLVIDFPIRGPANATALNEELPPLMADFARVQDDLGNVHFSRFMIKGDEKLLFLSDVDGEGTQHVERLVDSAGPVFEVIFDHVIDPPATPVADNREEVVKWLRDHVRAPLDMYFAYPDASVQDIKACAREAGFTGNTAQSPLLTYMPIKSRLQGVALKFDTRDIKDRGKDASDAIGTLHFSHWVPFDKDAVGFFTIFDGDFTKYIQDFTDRTSFVFDSVFPHVIGAPPTPIQKNANAFYQWALDYNYPPIGFYSAYPGLSVQDVRALLADRKSQSTIT